MIFNLTGYVAGLAECTRARHTSQSNITITYARENRCAFFVASARRDRAGELLLGVAREFTGYHELVDRLDHTAQPEATAFVFSQCDDDVLVAIGLYKSTVCMPTAPGT
jgi:hypothetical protein